MHLLTELAHFQCLFTFNEVLVFCQQKKEEVRPLGEVSIELQCILFSNMCNSQSLNPMVTHKVTHIPTVSDTFMV